MKGWLFTGPREPLQLIERETPRAGPGEAVIAVKAAGLCHSDVGVIDGTITSHLGRPPPIILGHELAGVVAEVAPGVVGWKAGDRVVAPGNDAYIPGWSGDGAYATHCRVPAANLVPLPNAVSFVQGAAATDAGDTAYSAIMVAGGLKPGQRVGLVGLGGLGMTGARIAVVNGAQVYAAEPRREAWETARAQGVTKVVEDVAQLAGRDLDLIVDFAGFGSTTAGAVLAVRRGGLVVQVGLGRTEATIRTDALIGNEVTLKGARGGAPGATAAVLRHIEAGELTIQATAIGFDDIPAGLERLERGGVVGRLVAEIGE